MNITNQENFNNSLFFRSPDFLFNGQGNKQPPSLLCSMDQPMGFAINQTLSNQLFPARVKILNDEISHSISDKEKNGVHSVCIQLAKNFTHEPWISYHRNEELELNRKLELNRELELNRKLENLKKAFIDSPSKKLLMEILEIEGHYFHVQAIQYWVKEVESLIDSSSTFSTFFIIYAAQILAVIGEVDFAKQVLKKTLVKKHDCSIFMALINLEWSLGSLESALDYCLQAKQIHPFNWDNIKKELLLSEKIAEKIGKDCPDQLLIELEKIYSSYHKLTSIVPGKILPKLYLLLAEFEYRFQKHHLSMCSSELNMCSLESMKDTFSNYFRCANKDTIWKGYYEYAYIEVLKGEQQRARILISLAYHEAPEKMKEKVLLQEASLEEYVGNIDEARCLYAKLFDKRLKYPNKKDYLNWRFWFSVANFEIRQGNKDKAIHWLEQGIESLPKNGRLFELWLNYTQPLNPTFEYLNDILTMINQNHPHSGEVFCQFSRFFSNPTSPHYNLGEAKKYLQKAIFQTPLYGDSFIEYLKVLILEKGMNADYSEVENFIFRKEPSYGTLWALCQTNSLVTSRETFNIAKQFILREWNLFNSSGSVSLSPHALFLNFSYCSLKELDQQHAFSKSAIWRMIIDCQNTKFSVLE